MAAAEFAIANKIDLVSDLSNAAVSQAGEQPVVAQAVQPVQPSPTRKTALSRSTASMCTCGAAAARNAANELLPKGKKINGRYKHFNNDCPAKKGSEAAQARKKSKNFNP